MTGLNILSKNLQIYIESMDLHWNLRVYIKSVDLH